MTLTLDIPADVQAALAEDARQNGQTAEQAALAALRRAYAPSLDPPSDEARYDEDQAAQQAILESLFAQAQALAPEPYNSPTRRAARESAFGQIITEKYRKKGYDV